MVIITGGKAVSELISWKMLHRRRAVEQVLVADAAKLEK
jgi:hypothetical protein